MNIRSDLHERWCRLQSASHRTSSCRNMCCLSWDSSSCVIGPSSDIPVVRPLPDDIAATVRPVAAKRPTRSDLVVSHHLAGLLRTSGLEFIAPRNRKEFAAFPGFASTFCQPKPTSDGRRSPFPARAVHTLRRIPLAGSRTASLRPLPSCRSVASRPFRTPKCSTRPTLRANKRRHICLSRSRSRQSASVTASVR